MTFPSLKTASWFETTKRLLARLVNEGLAIAELTDFGSKCEIQILHFDANTSSMNERWVKISTRYDTLVDISCDRVLPILRPECLQPPVILVDGMSERDESHPSIVFRFISVWLKNTVEAPVLERITRQLQLSTENQEKWMEMSIKWCLPTLQSPLIAWEQSQVFGHPTHPFHRLCWTHPLLEPVVPEDIPKMRAPSLTFVAIPRRDVRLTGAFESTLQPLLRRLCIEKQDNDDRITVPCLTQQLPVILHFYPGSIPLKEVSGAAKAQASMRTITLCPELEFQYHMKFSLACQITSAFRMITPWTAAQGLGITDLLAKVAAVSGNRDDSDVAKQLGCILREDPEPRARDNNEALIVVATLLERQLSDGRTHAEKLFNLDTAEARKEWYERSYVKILLRLVLHPLIHHGISLWTHDIKGFAVRDFNGVKFHRPTLQKQGFDLSWEFPGSATLTDDLESVWDIMSHCLSHIASLIYGLRLERHGAWAVVRTELCELLKTKTVDESGFRDYFLRDVVPFKCLMSMELEGKRNVDRDVPNPLVRYT
ncbi:IucC family-domain-containing protein [Aspergillus ambiguus]|uniref:IucA/IucC family siderophore biosynthesis protein n=1 Tax=Aspergillus ambiguus TaxID=176160 RepID=UPI003CCD577B